MYIFIASTKNVLEIAMGSLFLYTCNNGMLWSAKDWPFYIISSALEKTVRALLTHLVSDISKQGLVLDATLFFFTNK